MAPIEKTKEIIKKLPEHKPKLDFLAAVLTVPVLITVLILNLSNLNKKNLPRFTRGDLCVNQMNYKNFPEAGPRSSTRTRMFLKVFDFMLFC